MNDKGEINLYKVFFIICRLPTLNNELQCSLSKEEGIKNLQTVFIDNTEQNKIISVYSFDIIPKELKKKETQQKKLKIIINIKYNNINYIGTILLKENKNNFIYDFKIEYNNTNNIIINLSN